MYVMTDEISSAKAVEHADNGMRVGSAYGEGSVALAVVGIESVESSEDDVVASASLALSTSEESTVSETSSSDISSSEVANYSSSGSDISAAGIRHLVSASVSYVRMVNENTSDSTAEYALYAEYICHARRRDHYCTRPMITRSRVEKSAAELASTLPIPYRPRTAPIRQPYRPHSTPTSPSLPLPKNGVKT